VKYFIKLSTEGSFPSGVDELGTYEIPKALHDRIENDIHHGLTVGVVKRV